MKLPRGITGFMHRRERATFTQKTDLNLFLQYSYTAAILCDAQITAIDLQPPPYSNYGVLVVEFLDRSIVVAINHIYPFVAFSTLPQNASSPLTGSFLNFVDCEPLAAAYRSFERYQVLSMAQAKAPPDTEMYTELAKIEIENINYWQPNKVGQIIFNGWD